MARGDGELDERCLRGVLGKSVLPVYNSNKQLRGNFCPMGRDERVIYFRTFFRSKKTSQVAGAASELFGRCEIVAKDWKRLLHKIRGCIEIDSASARILCT